MVKVKRISSNLIKPLTPTPQSLKTYQISFVDQFILPMNVAVILFYQSKPQHYIRQLKESLAETLVEFYVLAGRYIKNEHVVDCSDQGALFVEAEGIELLGLVASNEPEQLNALFPPQYFQVDEAAEDPLLLVQATRFPCGGAAVAVSVSHRVFDASSLGAFVAFWSKATNPDENVGFIPRPTFKVPSLLPYWDLDLGPGSDRSGWGGEKVRMKRLSFDREALTSLRSEIGRETVSRARVACAVVAGALTRTDLAKRGDQRDLVMYQMINMRERTVPPQPKHVCGNFAVPSHVRRITASRAGQTAIRELVGVIGDGVRSSISEYAEILSSDKDGRRILLNTGKQLLGEMSDPETNVVIFTDWTKFGFYEADFGWGKPVWTGIGQLPVNLVVLMSDKEGDGVEAWVCLKEDEMRYFEEDEEIKSKYLHPKIQG